MFSYLAFFFTDTATTEIYPLSLHDALPIYGAGDPRPGAVQPRAAARLGRRAGPRRVRRPHQPGEILRARPRAAQARDRKSTRLNSSHQIISYAVFCLKKKKKKKTE